MLKLPRTIRLDPSDTFVFARVAEPGEWAVSGAFIFGHGDISELSQKERVALRSGFLGTESFGWSTLAVVTEASADEREQIVQMLSRRFIGDFGAPNEAAARQAAEDEVDFAASLCDHPPQTLLAVQRTVEAGELRERFRTLKPRAIEQGGDRLHGHARAFTFHEVDGEDQPAEEVDLLGLTKERN